LRFCHFFIGLNVLLSLAALPQPLKAGQLATGPAMKKLFRAFLGDWTVVETFEHSAFFPNGGARNGSARFTMGTGGTSLIEDYHSDGSAGKLDFLMVIWWDANQELYQVFTRSNDPRSAGQLRGTAYWDGGGFVNDYEEVVSGKNRKFQDRFSELTARSFTLAAGICIDTKTIEPLITTKYTR
jgi:hypothetical protein